MISGNSNSCLSGKTMLPDKQNYSTKPLSFLRHPQTITSLLALGQGGDFSSQRVDILLVPEEEVPVRVMLLWS